MHCGTVSNLHAPESQLLGLSWTSSTSQIILQSHLLIKSRVRNLHGPQRHLFIVAQSVLHEQMELSSYGHNNQGPGAWVWARSDSTADCWESQKEMMELTQGMTGNKQDRAIQEKQKK